MIGCAFNISTIKYRNNDEICCSSCGVSNNFLENCTKWKMIRKINERNYAGAPRRRKDWNTQMFHVARNLKNEDLKTSQKIK